MAMSRWLAPGVVVSLGVAIAACDSPDHRDDQETVTTKQTALTTSLFLPYVAYATGSFPEAVIDACETITDRDPFLTLEGLRLVHERNRA